MECLGKEYMIWWHGFQWEEERENNEERKRSQAKKKKKDYWKSKIL